MLSSLLKRTKSKGVILRALCTLSVFFVVMIVLVSCGGFQPYISTTTQEGENIPAFEDLTETITDACEGNHDGCFHGFEACRDGV